jgi:hypothetical protein
MLYFKCKLLYDVPGSDKTFLVRDVKYQVSSDVSYCYEKVTPKLTFK